MCPTLTMDGVLQCILLVSYIMFWICKPSLTFVQLPAMDQAVLNGPMPMLKHAISYLR